MQSVDWREILTHANNINDQLFDTFYSNITSIINKHATIRKLSREETRAMAKAWITSGIRKSITFKNKLFRNFLKHTSELLPFRYKAYRNRLKHVIIISKKFI